MGIGKKYGFAWVTLGFLVVSLVGHWLFAWFAYVDEQKSQAAPVEVADYLNMTLRDTFENWQSEFLQLLWQVSGLAMFWYVGSPQSKDSEDRTEEKLDAILRAVDAENAEKVLAALKKKYPEK